MNLKEGSNMIKILQYGEGNFLRAFADAYFETLNREYGGYEVHVVMPIPAPTDRFEQQNNRYHVILRGMAAGEPVERVHPVGVVKQVINPFTNPQPYYSLAKDPDLKLIVSNTTEAGICFQPGDTMDNFDAMAFPGKLTLFLYARFCAGLEGVYLLPVELIDNNADQLQRCVEQYMDLWQLPEEFRRWNATQNHYSNTLVDRIVSGYPKDDQTRLHLEELLGQKDALMTVGEPFGLWVIEQKAGLERYIHQDFHNIQVILTDDVTPYKTRKVRVLNGSHTNLVPAGLLLGARTVYDCMNDDALHSFLKCTLQEEIIPFVPGSEQFAADVLERFRNPYLNHQLTSIALNSISKWKARALPSFRAYYQARGKLPKWLTIGFSYLMALYSSAKKAEVGYVAQLPAGAIPLQDTAAYLEHFANGGTIRAFMEDAGIWGEDLTAYPGFCEAVTDYVQRIRKGERLI